jgi:hypothetical protein
MGGYKVRLDDGSEIGPLDLASVRSWYDDGLLNPESLVLAPGSRRWSRLRQTIDIRAWGGGALRSRSRRGKSAVGGASAPIPRRADDSSVDTLRAPLAGSLLIACAALAGFWAFRPEHVRGILHEWPWWQIALGFLALGLALFVRPRVTRVIVFGTLLLGAVATLAMVGVLAVGKAPLPAYLVLAGGLIVLLGFVALLEGRSTSWLRTTLGTLTVLGASAGVVWVGYIPSGHVESTVQQWVEVSSELTDTKAGVKIHLPPGWRLVREGAPFLPAPGNAIARVARVDATAFGFVTAETAPRGLVRLEPLADRAVVARRITVPSLRSVESEAVDVAGLPARRALGESGDAVSPTREIVAVWRDGFTLFTLVGWGQAESRSEMGARFEPLLAGFESLAGSGKRLAEAVQRATTEVPFLSPATAERLMSMSEAGVLEPPEVFKRALALGGKGIPRLGSAEVREMQVILDQAYRGLERSERKQLADYLGEVRGGGSTGPIADQSMCTVMGHAVAQLPGPSRERLQTLYEKAIAAVIEEPAPASN